MLRALLAALAAVLLLLLPSGAGAAPFGAADTGWSGDGVATIGGGEFHDASGSAILRDPEGGFVSAGFATDAGRSKLLLTRHTANGTLDTTFGTAGGATLLDVGGGVAAHAITRLADGTLVVVGAVTRDADGTRALVARFSAGGQPLGTPIVTHHGDGRSTEAHLVEPASGGGLIVAGSTQDGAVRKLWLARLNADLTPDAAFGAAARYVAPGDAVASRALALRETAGGVVELLASGGRSGTWSAARFRIARDGSLCAAPTLTALAHNAVRGLFQPGGAALIGTPEGIVRVTPEGAVDTSFGSGPNHAGGTGTPNGMALLEDGRIAYIATTVVGTAPVLSAWALGLLTAAGDPDPSFDGDGYRIVQVGKGETSHDADLARGLVTAGNDLVVTGQSAHTIYGLFLGEEHRFAIARFAPSGQNVSGFGSGGLSRHVFGSSGSAEAVRMTPTSDGSLLVAGSVGHGRHQDLAVWRLGPSGVPVPGFGTAGLAQHHHSDYGSAAREVRSAPDGALYAAGHVGNPSGWLPAIFKLTASGGAGGGFGSAGVVQVTPGTSGLPKDGDPPACGGTPRICRDDDGQQADGGAFTHVLPLAGGDLIAVGSAGGNDDVRHGSGGSRLLLVRVNSDGTLDAGFGTGGVAQYYTTPDGATTPHGFGVHDAALVGGGKLLVGLGRGGADTGFMRFDVATGALDTTYSGDGLALVPIAQPELTLLPDGSALVAGRSSGSPVQHVVAKLGADGAPAGGFGNAGTATISHPELMPPFDSDVTVLADGTVVARAEQPFAYGALPRGGEMLYGLTASGAPRADFGGGGLLRSLRTCELGFASTLAGDPNGGLFVAAGKGRLGSGTVVDITRFVAGTPTPDAACPPRGGSVSLLPAGDSLTCAPGARFLGASGISVTYQWLRESDVIAGASGPSYTPGAADAGHVLACRIIGTNAYGSTTNTSPGRRIAGTPYEQPPERTGSCAPSDPDPTPDPEPPAVPPADPPATPPLVVPPGPPPGVAPPAAAPKVSALLTLPSSRRCASRRKFTVRVRREIRGTVRRVTIFLNGRRVKSVAGSRIGLPIDLRGLPKGKVKVRLRVELADGRVATDTRTYRTCATKKRRGRFGRRA